MLWQQVFADGNHSDPLTVHLVLDTLPCLRATELQVPVYISGPAGSDLGRLGKQADRRSSCATFRSHAYSPTLR